MIRRPSIRILVSLGFALLPVGPAAAAGNAERGSEVYRADGCYECHGTVGQGGAAGPRLAPKPLAADAIEAYIRQPPGQMPPYPASLLTDADIVDIQAYLASIKPPPPGALEEKLGPPPKFESKASP